MRTRPEKWTPPPGWVPAPSAVAGITVFAPAPEAAEAEIPTRTQCPHCAGTLAYDPGETALKCGFCGHIERDAPDAIGPSEGHEFTLEALRRAAKGWGTARSTLRCGSCAAELSVTPDTLATACPFCASAKVEVIADAGDALRPGFVLPFAIREADLAARIKEWLGQGWMHPSALKDVAAIESFVGIYLPYWLFDAGVTAEWEAEVGRERTESYTDSEGKRQTRKVIDWDWKRGTIGESFDGVRIPGTAKVSKRLLGRLHGTYDLAGLCAYAPEVLAGFRASGWDVGLPEAWEEGRTWIREEARRRCMSDTGSAHVRNFRMTAALRDERWRYALLPVWATAYRYDQRVWQVLVSGQTGAVEGQRPVVWPRVYAVMALALFPAVCSGVLGIPLLVVGGVGAVFLVFAVIFLVMGGIFAHGLYHRAFEAESA